MSFELTRDKIRTNQLVSVGAAATSLVCCICVLLAAAWVWSVRSARGFLDRVSFRLLLSCLVWEIVYDVNYISVVLGAKPNAACAVGVYFMIGTLGVVNYLCTCIAINLFVTIVLGLNPVRMGLERWYIGGSIFLGLFVPIVPAALGHFGWDPIFKVCWIKSSETARVTNFVLDLYLWQLLSCAIATLAVAITLWKLFRQGRATSRALFGGDSLNFDMSSDSTEDVKTPRRARLFRRRRSSIKRERMFGHLEDRFVSIAIRVSLYPITLVVINGIIAIGDLYISLHGGVKSKAVYGLYCVYYLFYGVRGVTFAALAALVDPCLGKGLKAAWAERFPRHKQVEGEEPKHMSSWSLPEPVGCVAPLASANDPSMNVGNVLDLSALSMPGAPPAAASHCSRMSMDSDGSMDVLQALFASEPPANLHSSRYGRSPPHDEEKRHGFHPHMPHLPHFHPHLPHLHFPNIKHLPWFLRRHLEKEQAQAEAELAAHVAAVEPTPPAPASPAATPASFTNAFTGVPADALPSWMNDGADDVVAPLALAAAQASNAAATNAADVMALERALSRVETGQDKVRQSHDIQRCSSPQQMPSPLPPVATKRETATSALAGLGHGVGAVMGTSLGLGMGPGSGTRRGSLASSQMSGSSLPGSARQSFSFSGTGSAASPAFRGSARSARPRWASNVGGRRSSVAEARTPLQGFAHDPRARREATLALAEKLYEEMEAQL